MEIMSLICKIVVQDRRKKKSRSTSMEMESMTEISSTVEADNRFGDSENQESKINEEHRRESRVTNVEIDSPQEMPVSAG